MGKTTASGTAQSATKALVLLRHIGANHAQGLRLTDLIALTGFDKSTVHRLLLCLTEEEFVERVSDTKLYRLGVESMQLGFASADMAPLVDRFRPSMQKIARISEDTVFLVVRSGDYAVFVHREEGAYPVKAFVADRGWRRPLGTSAVGIAMLSEEVDDEVAAVYARQAQAYKRLGMTQADLRRMVKAARKVGFSEVTDFGPVDTAGVGYAFRSSPTMRIGISIAAVSSRMGAQRRRELGLLLRQEFAPLSWDPNRDPSQVPPGF